MDRNLEVFEQDARVTRQGRYSAWLKKAKSKNACFKRIQSHVMRYFTIDFDAHIIFYSHSSCQKKMKKVSQPIPFMHICGAEELPLPEKFVKGGKNSMIFGFILQTKYRIFELFTSSSDDAAQWTHSLNVAMLLGKLKCLERVKVLQDQEDGSAEMEEEEEALKQVEEAAAKIQADAALKKEADNSRLRLIEFRAQEEVAARRKQEDEEAERMKQVLEAARQEQVLQKQAADLQMLQLQVLVQEEELAARQEQEEKAAARKKKDDEAAKKKAEEAAAGRKQVAKEVPCAVFESSILVEALAIFLAQDAHEDKGYAAEWKEIRRLEEKTARYRKQPGAKIEATSCLNPGSRVVLPGSAVPAQIDILVDYVKNPCPACS